MIGRFLFAALAVAFAGYGAAALAQQDHSPVNTGETRSIQGGNNDAWFENAHIHAFYDLTVETLGKGTDGIDFAAYRDKSYAIFRAFGASMGWEPEKMVDHLKDIPRQIVGIVKEDPHVLDSFESFRLALEGPP
ncbi:MAG: hypothetical protein GC155_12245 [Alphaproteobacteria bacterium]|nr:hypothetical protein [Alphaproteobacteria bacterium]